MTIHKAEFNIGDIVFHKEHAFRGVIVDVDPQYEGTEEWYQEYTSKPSRQVPWYHVLVDEESSMAYVSEQTIRVDLDDSEVHNPMVDDLFSQFDQGHYLPRQILS